MQLVPYIPIPLVQLTNENVTNREEEEEIVENNQRSPTVAFEEIHDGTIFKIPSIPTPYTVEEPCDHAMKRNLTMKRYEKKCTFVLLISSCSRSFSQSDQYNSNLSVTELKADGNDYSSIPSSQSAYFIVEPSTAP